MTLTKSARDFFRDRAFLIIVLIVFVFCKIPHLSVAYYWDESTPYAPAVYEMYQHGASLLPGSMDPELSRGHPLLFHALAALWMDIFGSAHQSTHSYALLIAVCCLISIYEAGLRLFNKGTAVLALLIAATQVSFFVQSSLLLLEILVGLLAFASLYFYATRRFLWAGVMLTCLFFTKESGLVVGLVLGIDSIFQFFRLKGRPRIYPGLSVLVPTLFIGLFFIVQKASFGWYLFPLHEKIIVTVPEKIFDTFRDGVIGASYYNDNKYLIYLLFGILAIVSGVKEKRPVYFAALLPIVMVFLLLIPARLDGVPYWIAYLLYNISFMVCLYSFRNLFENPIQRKLIVLGGWFIVAYQLFCAMNFFTGRYALEASTTLLFLLAVFMYRMIQGYKGFYIPVLILTLVIGGVAFYQSKGLGDTSLGAFDGLYVQQKIVDELEKSGAYNEEISAPTNLNLQHLVDYRTGFLSSHKSFVKAKWDLMHTTKYAVFDCLETTYIYDIVKQDSSFKLMCRFTKGEAWSEIYKRK